MQPPLLDPRNDLVFKCLFAHSKPLLTDLSNAVLHPAPPLEVVEILNPQVHLQHIHDKFIVLDILARAADGRLLNVEMQMQQREVWSQHGIYYLAKTLAGQLKSGAQYADLQAVLGIHFLAYDLFPEADQAQWCFEMRDRQRPHKKLGSELQLNIIELSKWSRLQRQSRHPATPSIGSGQALHDWLTWFTHWKEKDIMNHIAHPAVLQAAEQLAILSADEETRQLAAARELALLTERLEINAAEKRGIAIGEALGEARGEARAMENALARMLAKGFTEAEARAILGFI